MRSWVQHVSGRWHAWEQGAGRSLCGTLTLDDLRTTPAKRIAGELPDEAVLCASCRRQLGPAAPAPPAPANLSSEAKDWLRFIRLHLQRARVQVARGDEVALAQRIAAVGPTSSPEARETFEQIRTLLLTPRLHRRMSGRQIVKLTHLRDALEAMPISRQAVQKVANAMRTWRSVTGKDVEKNTRYDAAEVVRTMLALPDVEPYVKHLNGQGYSNLAFIFHGHTLEKRRHDAALRGLFGGSPEYFEKTSEQLDAQIVTDPEPAEAK